MSNVEDQPFQVADMCVTLPPESIIRTGLDCFSNCAPSLNDAICNRAAESYAIELQATSEQSNSDECPSGLTRYLCRATPASIRLCAELKEHELVQGETCWTGCGEHDCPIRVVKTGEGGDYF